MMSISFTISIANKNKLLDKTSHANDLCSKFGAKFKEVSGFVDEEQIMSRPFEMDYVSYDNLKI